MSDTEHAARGAALDLWPDSGYRTLEISPSNRLLSGDAFLRWLWSRPELAPIDGSCDAERRLHDALMQDPRRPVAVDTLSGLQDADARENYRAALAFRDLLLAHEEIEIAYLRLVQPGQTSPAAPLVDLMTRVLVQHLVTSQANPFACRAGELFFRTQKAALENGVQLADAQSLARIRNPGAVTVLQLLIQQAGGGPAGPADGLPVLTDANAERYFEQRERHEMVLDLAVGGPGMQALERLLEQWIRHFTGARVEIRAVPRIDDPDWRWHIGLDRESNQILNRLYQGEETDSDMLARIVALFSMDMHSPGFRDSALRGHPVHLGLAVDGDGLLRMKPQNLLVNLPELSRT